MSRASSGRGFLAFLLIVFICVPTIARANFADTVLSYVPGDVGSSLQNASAALGLPNPDTTFGVLTPFNAAFDPSQIMGIGEGGSLVLHLAAPAPTGQGRSIGVHAAVGIIDTDYPNGNPGAVATPYTEPRAATVFVSPDNAQWHSLGPVNFDLPSNYYSQGVTTPGYQPAPGTIVADFFKPFTGALSDFDGKNWPQILSLLDGSGGGTWLDLTGVPYPSVNYIRFDVTQPGQRMILDSVVVAPEPVMGMGIICIALLARRRR